MAALLPALFGISCATSEPAPDSGGTGTPGIIYLLEPRLDGAKPALHVELVFRGEQSGTTRLLLPHSWASQHELERGVHDLRVLTRGAELRESDDPHVRTVTHAPGQVIRVSYDLRQDWEGLPAKNERYYRPILQDDYFHFIGHAAFVHPAWDEAEPRPITLRWNKLPEDWELLDSLGARAVSQSAELPLRWLLHSVFFLGELRVQELKVEGKPVWLALHGKWKFPDAELARLLSRIMTAQRRFWNDDDFPYFLVTVLSVEHECCSLAGTGLFNSFATFVSDDLAIDSRLKHLLAHELFHTWNGRRIVRQEPEERMYWFSEGFTDYYTRLLNLRAGLIDLPEYVRDYNAALRQYFTSPVRDEGNERVLADFWNDPDVERLPYLRGDILAHNWNAEIRARGVPNKKIFSRSDVSLDDVMRDLLKAAQSKGTLVSPQSLESLLKPYLARSVSADLRKYIDKGETLRPSERSLGPCARLMPRWLPRFDLGFDDVSSKRTHVVAGVYKGGAAWRAGLRDGQLLQAWSIETGNAEKPVELTVVDHKGRRTLRFLPAGKRARVPQFRLDAEKLKRDPRACLAWFG
jgi:predicted metalloprotease with PDZ domain